MSGIDQLPPWEGPDLLADARAAALKAGQAIAAPANPAVRPKPKERTWADFEVKDTPIAAKPVGSSSLPPALLEKIKQQNAIASAIAQAEREAEGKKPALVKRTQKVKRPPKPKGPPKGSRNHSKLNAAQVAEIWSSLESCAAVAAKYGVSAMTISSIRRGKLWGSMTVTLGEPGVMPLRGRRDAASKPADSQQASKD